MKLSKEELVLTSGAHRSRTGEFESSFEFKPTGRLIYSDWHCSIFSLDSASSSCILYGLLQEKSLNSSITSAASNDSWVFVKTPACILAIEKNSGTEVYGHVSGVTQIASDGQNVFYLKDELLYLLKVSKLEGIISVDRPFSTSIKIRSISCGSGFLLCLTFSGQVFSQGIGSRGQLGLGDLSDRMKLTLIEALQVLTVTQISSGNWHSVCLTDTGDVYTWGWNEHGQLGHKSLGIRNKSTFMDEGERQSCISVLALPTPVDFPDELYISQIACGGRHTVCLTEAGDLFCFGWNGYGQLGLDSSVEAVDTPLKHPFLKSQHMSSRMTISSVYCGLWSTTIYLKSKE